MKKSSLCCVFVRQAATLGLGLGLLIWDVLLTARSNLKTMKL